MYRTIGGGEYNPLLTSSPGRVAGDTSNYTPDGVPTLCFYKIYYMGSLVYNLQ